jgi:hypothetical protein
LNALSGARGRIAAILVVAVLIGLPHLLRPYGIYLLSM